MTSEINKTYRVGSRKSELALIQTNYVIESLKKLYPKREFTVVTMTTLGDRILDVSLPKIGEKSLFTKDLEDALRNETVDFVVHSLKDLPTTLPDGLAIGAVFEREDPRDALVLRDKFKGQSMKTLPAGSVIGTSSLRRTAQLKANYPHLNVTDVRGNLNTRLRKLNHAQSEYSALLLASAGMSRMGWKDKISEILPCAEMKYAVGQGALAVECRSDHAEILEMLSSFNHPETYCRVLAERSFLKTLGGGCSAPVGVSTRCKEINNQYKLSLTGGVWSLDGTTKIIDTLEQTFAQIKSTSKHQLSPTGDECSKKLKVDEDIDNNIDEINPLEDINPIEELNRNISERAGDLNCEDTRSLDEIKALKPPIFCGMTENFNITLDVIEKCEKLGIDLANVLIEKGALEVMKVTQDFIRSSTAVSKES